ncbi:MotA/TolQ/ExbB proton channel family protein [bacterium]|nr:MotA/TolQ/ExbB proton channel family protein [candidate division CSSED10-310 bacterium]
MNLLDTLIKGGPLMIFIGLCSIITVAVGIERWMRLKGDRILPAGFAAQVLDLLRLKQLSEAVELCGERSEPGILLIRQGLNQAGSSRDVIREHFENAGRQVDQELKKGLGVLATVASISPLLGLMGTVMGMIRVFRVISIQGVGDPGALSGGISEALITTAAGLAVGIPTLILHNYFLKRAEGISLDLEKVSSEILNQLDTAGAMDTGGFVK